MPQEEGLPEISMTDIAREYNEGLHYFPSSDIASLALYRAEGLLD